MFDGLTLSDARTTAATRWELDPLDPINRGLVAWWPLNAGGGTTARDLSPRRRHGTLTGFASSGWAVGRYGRALTFDGVDDHIPLGGRWLNNLPRGSFCVRIRPNAGGGVAYYEDGGGFNNFAFNVPTTGSSALTVYIGSNTARQSTTRTWVATTWYDIVVTWGDDIRIYVDGSLDTVIAVAGGTTNGAGDNDQIGRYSYGGGNVGQYTPASISHIRIFGRTLTYSEVQRRRIDLWAGTTDPAARLFFAARPPTSTSYSLTAAAGTFALTGQAVALKYGRRLALANGSFTLSGQTVALNMGRRLPLSAGSFALTGQAVTLRRGYAMPITAGTFTLSGQSITFLRSRRLLLGTGSFTLSGQTVALNMGRRLPLSAGSFTLTGQDATLRRGYAMPISAGTFALSGQSLALRASRRLSLSAGTFTLTGQPVSFTYSGSGTVNYVVLVWDGVQI